MLSQSTHYAFAAACLVQAKATVEAFCFQQLMYPILFLSFGCFRRQIVGLAAVYSNFFFCFFKERHDIRHNTFGCIVSNLVKLLTIFVGGGQINMSKIILKYTTDKCLIAVILRCKVQYSRYQSPTRKMLPETGIDILLPLLP